MMRARSWYVALLPLLLVGLAPAPAAAFPAYGLTTAGQLLLFDTDVPLVSETRDITGLQPGETIVAIDIRPKTARLYGLSNQARLYTISVATGLATLVGTDTIGLALDGTAFGFDVDPLSDRIRVVSNTGQNFRINPITGDAIDGDVIPPGTQPDTPLTPGAPNVQAAAFSNNFDVPANTRLYVLDGDTDALKFANSPNTGVLTDVGPLGLDITTDVAFDIAGPDVALAAVPEGAGSRLYRIDLASGAALPGPIVGEGLASQRLRGLAVQWFGDRLVGITTAHSIVTFNSMKLASVTGSFPLTGFQPGESILGIDYRPSTPGSQDLYALGSTGRLYRISPLQEVTQIGLGTFAVPLDGTDFGFAFDPATDLIRVVSNTGQNFRVHPGTGTVVDGDPDTPGVQPDTPLNPDTPHIVGLAYTRSPYGNLQGALAGLDATLDSVVRIGAPNDPASANGGTVTPLSPGYVGDSGVSGFGWSPQNNIGFASVIVGGQNHLLRVTPQGRPFDVGDINTAQPIVALTVQPPGQIQVTGDSMFVYTTEGAGAGNITVARTSSALAQHVEYVVTGTATNGVDYVLQSGVVEFEPGFGTAQIPYTITQDADDEIGETIVITLQNPSPGAPLGPRTVATITIADDDGPPNVPPTITILTPTTEPELETSNAFISLSGVAADDKGVVAVTWDAGFVGGKGLATGTTEWTIDQIGSNSSQSITVTVVDTDGATATDTLVVSRDLNMYSLAEGATGAFFDLDLLLANPNNAEAPVEITFLTQDGTTVVQNRVLPPTSRTTIAVDEIPGLEAAEVSAVVISEEGLRLAVERTMRWDASGYGAHTEKAFNGEGAKTWYFAEGSQGFFDTYVLLANPTVDPIQADVEMFGEDGAALASQQYDLAPHSRLTIHAGGIPALVNRSFWTRVTFSTTGLAERAMYFGSPLFNAGHESAGVTAPAQTWFHAEGATGGFFTTFLLLANPNDQPADVTLTYLPASGASVTTEKTLAPHARETINIASEDPSLTDAAVATRIEASRPILSERAMYWPGEPLAWNEAHTSFGEIATHTSWALAEGRVGGAQEYSTYILLANPGDEAATVTVTYLREDAAPVQKQYVVPPTSRFNIDVGGMVPEVAGERFGAFVQSTLPIFVERAMYSNVGGVLWAAGTNATATRIP